MTAATHTLLKLRDHSATGSENTQTWIHHETIAGRQDTQCPWITPQYWSDNPIGTAGTYRRPYISNREPLPRTEARDTIWSPSTNKLSRRNLSQHTWHQYVTKTYSWLVEMSCVSKEMLQSKVISYSITIPWSHEQYRRSMVKGCKWLF